MIEITISTELSKTEAGVYQIDFSNGRFYIGSSVELKTRIRTHCNSIKSGFATAMTCKSLLRMKGFEGAATFSLLEEVIIPPKTRGGYRPMDHQQAVLKREWYHIKLNKDNPLILNDPGYGIGNATILASIDPEIKKALYERAETEGVPVTRLTGRLLMIGLKNSPERLFF